MTVSDNRDSRLSRRQRRLWRRVAKAIKRGRIIRSAEGRRYVDHPLPDGFIEANRVTTNGSDSP